MKKYSIVIGVVVFVALVIFINSRINSAAKTVSTPTPSLEIVMAPSNDVSAQSDYFEAFRESRRDQREMELLYLDSMIQEERTDAETLADAQQQKLAIVDSMEKEFVVEQLLISKGFSDAAVTVRQGSVNVILKSDSLSDQQVAQILDIVCRETGEKAKDVKISTAKQ